MILSFILYVDYKIRTVDSRDQMDILLDSQAYI